MLDNLSTHSTPDIRAWLTENPHVHFHFTPVGSSWINQIETWFGIITRQSIRRGTFTSVNALMNRIRDYITHWNTNPNHSSGPPPPTRSSPRSRRPDQHPQTRRKQHKVKPTGSRDTRWSRRAMTNSIKAWQYGHSTLAHASLEDRENRREESTPTVSMSSVISVAAG